MLYKITKNSEIFPEEITVQSKEELFFAVECFIITSNEEIKINSSNPEINFTLQLFEKIGLKCKKEENNFLLSKSPVKNSKTVVVDFSENPAEAISFSICCASSGIQADIKGLDNLINFEGADVISLLQKELYRFNINTDFCDYSKLKIYNTKTIQKKIKPVDVSENSLLSLFFIPIVLKFSEIEFNLDESFFEKYDWIEKTLETFGFSFKKL